MRRWLLGLLATSALLGSVGCASDPRPAVLHQAMDVTRQMLADPRIAALAAARSGANPNEKRCAALLSPEGQRLLPPRSGASHLFELAPAGQWPARILLLPSPDIPWSVVVRPGQEGVLIEGYGNSLKQPIYRSSLNLAP